MPRYTETRTEVHSRHTNVRRKYIYEKKTPHSIHGVFLVHTLILMHRQEIIDVAFLLFFQCYWRRISSTNVSGHIPARLMLLGTYLLDSHVLFAFHLEQAFGISVMIHFVKARLHTAF